MTRFGYVKIFKDPDKLLEMFLLRINGWTVTRLAEKYRCDSTTITHHCRKNKIYPQKKPQRQIRPPTEEDLRKQRNFKEEQPYFNELGEKINPGKDYKEYLLNKR